MPAPASAEAHPAHASDRTPLTDPRAQRQLRRAVGVVGAAVAPAGLLGIAVGAWLRDPAVAAAGFVELLAGLWLLVEYRTSRHRPAASLALRAAIAMNVAIVLGVTAEPAVGIAMAMAAVIPSVVALVYVPPRVVFRVMLLGAATGVYAALAGSLLPWGSHLTTPWNLVIPAGSLVLSYAAFQVFLWNASSQMTDIATELSAAMDLSREVAQTLDPVAVGRIIARHIARAAEVADCTLSLWDRAADRVVTFAYFPSDMPGIDPSYDLARFPATRRVLMTGEPCFVDAADPASDPNEIEYLASVGQRSMVILPLVVRGESIGILELTSTDSEVFSERSVQLAQLLAREATVSLENARLYDEIHDQAFRDALTGLANRRLFLDRLSHVLDRLRGRSSRRVAVLFMDLDHFKVLNDRFGHSAGDEILQVVGERLRLAIRPGDTAARLGGDEFAILLEDVSDGAEAVAVADRLLESVSAPIPARDGTLRIGTSIGVAMSGVAGDSADDLLRNADIAMYAAKGAGRGRHQLFHPELLERAAARSDVDTRLRGAVEREELRLEYQPIVELAPGRRWVAGVEALVRWEPPGRPTQMPAEFIGIAEESGEIMAIGRWVLHEACSQVSIWQHAHSMPDLRVNVNLSARQFSDPGLTGMIASALRDSGLPPRCLTLEITESTLMAQTRDTIERVREIRSMGVRISIDDFGTGYSSLGYLQAFELDELKIDRSFVSPSGTAGTPRTISRAIVELGRALGLEIVVEGIESSAQARWFSSLGCRYAQGFHYAAPMPPVLASAYLAGHRETAAGGKVTPIRPRRDREEAAGA
ncbi:MAG TPA: EAL domain-containing protein [Candidatus Limnocylindrales bacterium]|nr:EAL domain-containing protein [Candidatus Limnocylindrales bacterium]